MGGRKHAGAEWVASSLRVADMSPLGVEVADLLGDVYDGIYHIQGRALGKVDWSNPYCIVLVMPAIGALATYDSNRLTRLVVLSHDRMIRVSIEPCNPTHLRLMFHKRHTREGCMGERMPTLEDHVAGIRDFCGE